MSKLTWKRSLRFVCVWMCMLVLLAACSNSAIETDRTADEQKRILQAEWSDILAAAKGQQVNIHMWGGSESINRYIDEWVAPKLADRFGVTLNRVPVNDIKDVINKLVTEKQAQKQTGSVDIIWINGENFKTAKEQELLYGPFAAKLPNAQTYANLDAPDLATDFGLPTDGLEAPWGKAQFVFVYDRAKIAEPPRSIEALAAWVKANKGKFTYPAPPDFTGSAFLRHVLYEQTGGYEGYVGANLSEQQFLQKAEPIWSFLNELEPYLWRGGETYPENLGKLDQLFASGEVWMTMGYDPARASNLVKSKTFPSTTRTFVLDAGTLSNTHYLAIPFNAPSPAGAMVAIDFLQSPEAQIAKFDPKHWGEDMILDPSLLTDEHRAQIAAIDRGAATLPPDVLAAHRVPEIPADFVEFLEKGWQQHVARK